MFKDKRLLILNCNGRSFNTTYGNVKMALVVLGLLFVLLVSFIYNFNLMMIDNKALNQELAVMLEKYNNLVIENNDNITKLETVERILTGVDR
jgi:ABC-type multidrug transport system fused ATPase/permease subunit